MLKVSNLCSYVGLRKCVSGSWKYLQRRPTFMRIGSAQTAVSEYAVDF